MPGDNRGGKVGGISGSWFRLQVDPVDTWLVDGYGGVALSHTIMTWRVFR